MNIPVIHGYIDRRILTNFTADPAIVQKVIPPPFRLKVYKGKAIVGICLIRLRSIKPKGFPDFVGVNSENGAHRIAVEWDEGGETKSGVYIPRRDTSLKLNALVGGRLFPGRHHYAHFEVSEQNGNYHVAFKSKDNTEISIDAKETQELPARSIFESLAQASEFFKNGELGYSPNHDKFEGLKLKTYQWEVKPLEVVDVRSSFFEDESVFPRGSVVFDNALLMKNVEHEWKSAPQKKL